MAKTGGDAAGHRRQPVLHRGRATTPASRPTTRSSATSPTGSTWSRRSASSAATRTRLPTQVVEIDKATAEDLVTSRPSCSRPARRRATARRSSSSSCRTCSSASPQTSVGEVVVVEGAYPIPAAEFGGVRVVTCPDWALGPGASLRCGLAALGDEVEAALIVLADGPQLDPRAVERLIEHRGDADVVVASYDGTRDHPAVLSRAAWARDPGRRAHARSTRRSSRATTWSRRATWTTRISGSRLPAAEPPATGAAAAAPRASPSAREASARRPRP